MRDEEIPTEAVGAELERILASAHFDASERNRRFLRYVVEQTLAGRAQRIKAYAIATTVFGRDERFDPQLDSIVRIEAGRLRRSLERYYLTEGRGSRLRIEIPRGGYVPRFSPAEERPAAAGFRSDWPSVLVAAFDEEGDQSVCPSFTRGFTRSLIIALARFPGLRVYGDAAAVRPPQPGGGCGPQPPEVDYLLAGQCALDAVRFEIDVLLVEARTGRAVWAETFERRICPAELIELRNAVANRVARALVQPGSALHADRARQGAAGRDRSDGYAAVLRFHSSWRDVDPEGLARAREGLERALARDPDDAEALACLSLVHSNMPRFGPGPSRSDGDPMGSAMALADRAVALAPCSGWTRYAQGMARWIAGDVEGGLEALETGRRLNPNDMTILAELGQRYAMLARWDRAAPMLEEAYHASPALPGGYRIGLFLHHFAHGRHAEALAEARRVGASRAPCGHLAIAAAAAELGLAEEARAAVAAVRALDPSYGEGIAADLADRNLAPKLIDLLTAALAKAGLPVRSRGRVG